METWVAGKMFRPARGSRAPRGEREIHLGPAGQGAGLLERQHLGGLAPPLTFTAGKPHPVDCWYYALLKNGKYSTPYGLKPVCEKAAS